MHESGEKLNEHTCSCILHLVEDDLGIGEQVHALATKIGIENNVAVGTSLASMYASNGRIEDMEFLFREMDDIHIWCLNSLILDCKKNKNWSIFKDGIFDGFAKIFELGLGFDSSYLSIVLDVCSQY
ncbi:pentatricopeptide repeat-containing protein At2g41080-like [Dendrobium catenatum]|uniref:pentatricopeptide repeat-containing protein At2g41080-like n=1 Tax=Dendrobium catenatum TaxID=906689 RepID=UPI0009F65261|nr:pentatricopeptide repeat-containing protein At2g41080-like [Dendrobium catenatum]